MDTSERSMQMRLASYKSWANTRDRSARTEAARKASHHTRFIEKARQKHPGATEAEVLAAADALRKAHYQELAARSKRSRQIKREEREAAKQRQINAELRRHGLNPPTAA